MKPVIAIVGRANVGKSTLFNRLAGKQVAIVEDLPGTTRDRVFSTAMLEDTPVTLVDTGGLGFLQETAGLEDKVRKQVDAAIKEADVIIFMVDVRDGLISADREIADQLRKSRKPVVMAANKADNLSLENATGDFYQLGLGNPVPISAHHNRGIGYLTDALMPLLPASPPETPDTGIPRLAIVGRPNVGKSMLLNALVGEERVIVDSTAGTTRDAVDTDMDFEGQKVTLIDTAGIRRRGKSGTGIEYYSLIRSLRAIDNADIALLVVDATEFITAQDTHIAGYIKQAYKGSIVVVNKCDLISTEKKDEIETYVNGRLKFMSQIPVLFISAKFGTGVKKIIPVAMDIYRERHKQLANSVVDKLIKGAVEARTPPSKGLRRLEVVRAYQDGVNPPSFFMLVNDPELVHFSYQRYLENKLRHTFGFYGTSIRLSFKQAPKRRFHKTGESKS